MITINRNPGTKLCELGGGSKPVVQPKCLGGEDTHIDARLCENHEGKKCVDIAHDLTQFPWPVGTDEFDGTIAIFCLEHIPYTKTLRFLKECCRICKAGAKSVFLIPNTEKQVQWILEHPQGWDEKDFFTSASEKLFGSQDDTDKAQEVHKGSYHAAYFNPAVITKLMEQAGFEDILVAPFGPRETDMSVIGVKSANQTNVANTVAPVAQTPQEHPAGNREVVGVVAEGQGDQPKANHQVLQYLGPNKPSLTSEQRKSLFGRSYFESYPGSRLGFYWDVPFHEVAARKVLERKPESVLELGCGRGYILKRLEDVGINCAGYDISTHAWLTRASDAVIEQDVLGANFKWKDNFDLCLSVAFLEYVPEPMLPWVVSEMQRTCKRGLHAITFAGQENAPDQNRCTLKSKDWWASVLPSGHEICSVPEIESGGIPEDYVKGDGKTKLNVGCAWTMFHHGWQNLDIIDATTFAGQYRYVFNRVDAVKGLPYGTGVVDFIFSSHFLEHLTYVEGLSFLRDCRRVIRPDGGMRLVVPDTWALSSMYNNANGFSQKSFSRLDEINGNCAAAPSVAAKYWSLLQDGHKACYDHENLTKALTDSGWKTEVCGFRFSKYPQTTQILKETTEMSYGYSLFVDAVPA